MSTLLEVRTKFVDRSGRIDLVGESGGNPDYTTDSGADWFVNQGQRLLDNMLPEPVNRKTLTLTLSAGEYALAVPKLRAPLEVWATVDDERWALLRNTQKQLRDYYEKPFSDIDVGEPLYWGVGYTAQDGAPSTSPTVNLLPPAEEDTTIEVFGTFYSDDLEDNSDTSWWSVNHPGLLVLAALHELEVSMRNTAGANDWMVQIARHIQMIDHDLAQGESVEMTEFEG